MSRRLISLLVLLAMSVTAQGATAWKAGQHYFLIQPAQPTSTGNKIEVVEVFSYGCIACNSFYPYAEKMKAALPPNAQMVFVPASFNSAEAWPMFQRAYCTAQTLGVADKAHKAMFDAIWASDELAVIDSKTQRIKKKLPTIEDAAKFYQRVAGVPQDKFLATAKSFTVEGMVKRADQLVKVYRVDSTPTIVVNGKYRLNATTAGGVDELMELVKWLVAQETK